MYMVYVEGASSPKKEHSLETTAVQEARRLSANNRGKKVYVLYPLTHFVTAPPEPQPTKQFSGAGICIKSNVVDPATGEIVK